MPLPKFVVLPICIHEGGFRDGGQHADEGLQLVPGHGVTDKGDIFVPEKLEKLEGLKPGQVALMGLPPPVEVLQIRPAVGDAILAILYGATSRPIVQRARLVVDPLAIGVVTDRRSRRRKKKRRGFSGSIASCLFSWRGGGEGRRDEDVVGQREAVGGGLGERERVEVEAEESDGEDGVDGVGQVPPEGGGEGGRVVAVAAVFERTRTTHLLSLSLSELGGALLLRLSFQLSGDGV